VSDFSNSTDYSNTYKWLSTRCGSPRQCFYLVPPVGNATLVVANVLTCLPPILASTSSQMSHQLGPASRAVLMGMHTSVNVSPLHRDVVLQVTLNPESQEAAELRSWWEAEGRTAAIQPLGQVRLLAAATGLSPYRTLIAAADRANDELRVC